MASDDEDQRHLQALYKWLNIQDDSSTQDQIRQEIENNPLQFLQTYIEVLPSHLLSPLTSSTTPSQRGRIHVVKERRRLYGQRHHPDELELLVARRRLRTLWKRLIRGNVPIDTAKAVNASAVQPAFPDQPSTSVNHAASHQGELFDHPRLSRLMQEQDEQEEATRDQEEEEEEESEQEEEEDSSLMDTEDQQAIEAFQFAVLQRFIRGDVSGHYTRHFFNSIANLFASCLTADDITFTVRTNRL